METCLRRAGLSLILYLALAAFDVGHANAAFLAIQFTDTAGGSTTQAGFTGWDFSAYNTTSSGGPQSTSYSVSDPGVPGGTVGLDVSQPTAGASTNTYSGSGIVTGTGNFAARVRSPGYTTGNYTDLYNNLLFAQGANTTLTLEITGLVPTNSYGVTLFGADPNNFSNATETFTGNNVNGTTGSTPTASETWSSSAPGSLTSYAATLVLTPNSNGQITIDVTNAGGSSEQAFLNGFQISDAPEPGSFGVALCALAGLAIRRQRRAVRDRSE